MNKIHRQSGVAAIWFIFIIGAIMSLGALAIEGSRYIGKKARLGDALEAASIAVGANDRVTKKFKRYDNKATGQSADGVAKLWIHHYIPDEKNIELTKVTRKDTEKVIGKNSLATPYKLEYFRYDIQAKTTQESWFSFSGWPSFDEQVQVANTGTSARIKGGHEPVDVVFVADFSGSMNGYSGGKKKITALKEAIKEVSATLYGVNSKSTFGFVPFTKRVVTENNNLFECVSPLKAARGSLIAKVRNSPYFPQLFKYHRYSNSRSKFYENNFTLEEEAIAETYLQWLKGNNYPSTKMWSYYHWKNEIVQKVDYNTGYYSNYLGDRGLTQINLNSHIDIARTATELSIDESPKFGTPMPYGHGYYGAAYSSYCAGLKNGKPKFYNLNRKDFSTLEDFNRKISSMQAGGGTDMYQGLLASPHQFYRAGNENRYIIVLSDGEENSDTFDQLVEKNLCKNMNKLLSFNAGGEAYNFKMFVVGIGFDPSGDAYNTCFGKDNIHPVFNMDKLKDTILSLITDDMGHNFERQ